jgi:hypothetical protein
MQVARKELLSCLMVVNISEMYFVITKAIAALNTVENHITLQLADNMTGYPNE